ncbi:hypothetical protein C8J56DRAFT_1061062 [Mycena floridula]|nr:hypothetical protein C8J56DRAFT_1061062 [Mycena floridula]
MAQPPQTPARPDKTTSSSHSSTPVSRSSAKISSSVPRSQEKLKDLLAHELFDAVFEHEDLLETVYPLPPNAPLDKRINDFVAAELANTPRAFSKKAEGPNYQPFTEFLNAILALLPPESRPYHKLLLFLTSTRQIQGTPDGAGDIKPDGVGVHRRSLDPLHWSSTEVAMEVKKTWPEMLAQAATYGRALLEQCPRWYSVVICFNHHQQTMRFCWYTRIGSFQTPAMHYNNKEDLTKFVRGLIGLASCNRFDSGIDDFRYYSENGLFFALPLTLASKETHKWLWWKSVAVLCQRISILGRATHVFRLDLVTELLTEAEKKLLSFAVPSLATLSLDSSEPVTTSGRAVTRSRARRARDAPKPSVDLEPLATTLNDAVNDIVGDQASLDSTTLDKLRNLTPQGSPWTADVPLPKSLLSTSPPPSLIVKMSLPVLRPGEVPIEPEMFEAVQGMHGIPEIIGHKLINTSKRMERFTNHRSFKASSDWTSAYSSLDGELSVENRHFLLIFLGTEGISLYDEKDPVKIVYALVDGMIGHLNLYLKNFLHRDPSVGNILMLKSVQKRSAAQIAKNAFHAQMVNTSHSFEFLSPHLKNCMGVIIDGDMAVRLGGPREKAKHGWGTPLFMSQRLMSRWKENPLRTAVDDLESFVWVLIWTILCLIAKFSTPTDIEQRWIENLSTDGHKDLATAKESILFFFTNDGPEEISREMELLQPLLQIWFSLIPRSRNALSGLLGERRGSTESQNLDDDLHHLILDTYVGYLTAGVEFLKDTGQYQ